MEILNFNTLVTLFVVAVTAENDIKDVDIELIENEWLIDAQNSLKESSSKIESYGLDSQTTNMVANHIFDSFKEFVDDRLYTFLVDNQLKIDEMPELKTQLMKWLEDLETLSNTSIVTENTHNVALEKYLITMDFMSNEVVGYFKNFNVESSESKKIMTKLESMVRDCVEVLVGHASFVETQIFKFRQIIGEKWQPVNNNYNDPRED